EDAEFTAAAESHQATKWHAIHSSGLIDSTHLRYNILCPGRLLHLRLLLEAPFDLLCAYQWAWNPGKTAFQGKHRAKEMVQQRKGLWQCMDKWLGSRPQRSYFAMAGDFNTGLEPEAPICGTGVCDAAGAAHQDQGTFQELLRAHRCCALNTWSGRGRNARTYVPPHATAQHGSQIDFIIVREAQADQVSRQATPSLTKFVPQTGCRHLPLQASILAPRRPRRQDPPGRIPPRLVQQALRQPPFEHMLHKEIAQAMTHMHPSEAQDADLDAVLCTGWRSTTNRLDPTGPASLTPPNPDTLTPQVHAMWHTRDQLHRAGSTLGKWRQAGINLRAVIRAWALSARLQVQTRALRKACRHKKIRRVADVVQADNVFQAAKQFAPRNPRRRLQLRTADGHLQTHEAEFRQIVRHFENLYDGPTADSPVLTEAIQVSLTELDQAFMRLKPGKALPGSCAPAALWKRFQEQVKPLLLLQYDHHLRPGASTLPQAWCLSELVLLPKPGKPMKSPAHLRPISLLPLQAKLLAAVLAQRLQGPANEFLQQIPQYAYVSGRSPSQALERVISHCASVRKLVQDNTNNIHGRRSGRTGLGLYGGCHLSLDISCAYDHVPWSSLQTALRAAAVPENLIQAVLLVHHTAGLHIKHCGMEKVVSLKRGLRQGCGLSPLLWAIYCGWLLQGMHQPEVLDVSRANTSYADDMHYAWTILHGRDLEMAYNAMKHILAHLTRHGLTISQDKTVVVLELLGPQARKALERYTVTKQGTRYFRFVVDQQVLLIKVLTQHVYLGAVISFRKFEQETFRHRLALARGTHSRLGRILRNRVVPVHLRLRLWLGCIWPALLHGLDCTGLPLKELQTLQVQLMKQARSIANSHSMITKESNEDFARRLRLPDPLRRLRQALEHRQHADQFLHAILRPGEAQQQWRTIVRGHLSASSGGWSDPTSSSPSLPTKLQPVDRVLHEVFSCEVCGQEFSTQASLRKHMYCNHLDAEQQVQRDQEVKASIQGAEMSHAKDGMPQCKHCLHQFSTWHAFNYHVNSRSCEFLRALYQNDTTIQTVLPLLTDALIYSQEVLDCAHSCNWQDLALLPCVQAKHHHCVECNHWSVKPQYVRRHMSQKHPECDPLIQRCIQDIKDAHLRACIGVFNGVYLHRRPEMAPPTELMMANGLDSGWDPELDQSDYDQDVDSGTADLRPLDPSTLGNLLDSSRTQDQDQQQDEMKEMRNMVSLLSTMVLRQETQQTILRQDTGFMIFVQTRTLQNLGQSLYHIGQAWHKAKRDDPQSLKAPMRVVLYQHFLEVIRDRFKAMLATPSARSTAAGMGWISADGQQVYGIKWDATSKQHVKDEAAPSFSPQEIEEALTKLVIAAPEQFVIQRFHATRPLAEEYQATSLGMFLEDTWHCLHQLAGSAVWAAGGCYLRHERMKMSALAKRLSSLMR
ncbi:unnamed protein product, partial [Symbiodinium sp. CCMP2456]